MVLGISILSELVTRESVKAGKMITFPLTGEGSQRTYYLVYRSEKAEISPYKEFISLITPSPKIC